MGLKNTPTGYGWLSIVLHWVSALAVVVLFAVGLYMVDLTYYDPLYHELPEWHKLIGVALALVTAWRLAWRWWSPAPVPLGTVAWQRTAAHGAHLGMLVLLFLVLMTGYGIVTADGHALQVFQWTVLPASGEWSPAAADWMGWLHYYGALALVGLAGGHGLAAIKHHFLDRDRTLLRMLYSSSH